MKTQSAILLVVAFLLVSGMATFAPLSTSLAQTGGPGPAPRYTVEAGTVAGGSYQLTGLAWHVSGAAGGGAYSLVASDRAAGGNQCCCTYLPIVLRNK